MNSRDFTKSVIDQLKFEGCNDFVRLSPSRFFTTDHCGVRYDFKVKYCLKPRRLGITDIHYIASWMSQDRIDVVITNGLGFTAHTQRYLDDNRIRAILNWNPGDEILNQLK